MSHDQKSLPTSASLEDSVLASALSDDDSLLLRVSLLNIFVKYFSSDACNIFSLPPDYEEDGEADEDARGAAHHVGGPPPVPKHVRAAEVLS